MKTCGDCKHWHAKAPHLGACVAPAPVWAGPAPIMSSKSSAVCCELFAETPTMRPERVKPGKGREDETKDATQQQHERGE